MTARTRVIALAAATLALVLPGTAGAKGPSEATITGPGLSSPLTISGDGEGDTSTNLGVLVTQGGFFPQAFGQTPNPLLAARPTGDLGSRYIVTYVVPGPSTDTLQQDLYPYAARGPLTYMQSGQRLWEQTTHGGWYRGTAELRAMLVRAGLPKTDLASARKQPGSRTGSRKVSIALGTGAGLALAAGALTLLRRRRTRPEDVSDRKEAGG